MTEPQELTPQELDALLGVNVTPRPVEIKSSAVWLPRFDGDAPPF